jgi:hydroxymethylglutaryl-CoA reductase
MPLPLGLGIGFKINGKNFIVPMAIEEPSVIAASSSIAKLIAERGSGFLCVSTP